MPSRPAGNSGPLPAAIYCRMSLAVMGDTTKVEDQERRCRALCEQLGWTVFDVYSDNSRSAWQRNKRRPEWERMLRDVEAGRVAAIVTYHGDRLVRQPRDLEKLIDLAVGKGIRLASPTGTRNLDNRDDRAMARVIAAFAESESAATSDRRKAQYDRWRREGRVRPGGRGGRAYGFATDGVTLIEAECEIIREMAARVLSGETVGSIARDVSARGARTPAGSEFTHGTVKKMLMRERLAGLMPDGESKAAWDPVLERETWERLRAVLTAKAEQFAYAANARKWLLSGIAVCGACGAPMQVSPSKGRGGKEYVTGYACRTGCRKAYRSAIHLDAYVSARTIALLNDPRSPVPHVPADPGAAAEWAALAAERAATESQVRDYTGSPGRVSLLMARLDSIDARMEQLRELTTSDGRARLLAGHAGMTREQWEELPLSVRRALVAASYRVIVLPASSRGPGFRTEDVRLEPLG